MSNTFNDFIDDLTASGADRAAMLAAPRKAAFRKPATSPLAFRKSPTATAAVAPRRDPLAAFDEQEPGIRAFLADAAQWSDFAASLNAALVRWKTLTPRQLEAARSMQAKVAARAAAPAQAPVDLAALRAMFDRARASGLKTPTFRAQGLTLSRAPDTGRNPGALYVKHGDTYLGKIVGTTYSGNPVALPPLQVIAADPLEAALDHGRKTGVCACCGRALTDPESVARSIGPICFDRYF